LSAVPVPTHAQPTPTHTGQPGASRPLRVEIIALTSNDALLEQIGQTLDGESTIRPADTLDAAREFIRPSQPCVLLLDAQGHPDIAGVIESVQSPDGTCIVVVFAPADAIADVSSALRGSPTFAILPVPVEPDQTIAVLEGARGEALARLALAAQPAAMPMTSFVSAEPSVIATPPPVDSMDVGDSDVPANAPPALDSAGARGGRNPRAWVLGLAVAAAIVAIVVGWLTLRAPSSDDRIASATAPANMPIERASPPPAADAAVVPAGSIDDLLERAHAAMGARRYTDPEGDNALAYFRAVLTQEPANDEATEGLQRIGVLLDERIKLEIGQRRYNDVGRTLAQLRLIRGDDPQLEQIAAKVAEEQIAAALDAGNLERASHLLLQASQQDTLSGPVAAHWREQIDRRRGDAQAQRLAQLVSARIREGKLVEPADDSARHYLAQLRGMPSAAKKLTDAATAKLQQAYLVKIREAATRSRREDLKHWVAEARALNVDPTRLDAAMRAAAPAAAPAPSANSHAERLAQLVRERVSEGRLLEPSQDSALAYLNALRVADPTGNAAASSTQTVSSALLEGGRKALLVQDVATAQRYANAAGQLGMNMPDVDALQLAISAAGASPAARVPPTDIKRTRYVPPAYPRDALAKRISGAVRLRLTVAGDGKVKSATVVNSDPADVFDKAALDAARRWRFKPFAADDPDIEATVMTNILFRPDDLEKP
jgi:TonB family protein